MNRAFFITGTDTGVGKTHVTCALLHATRQRGWSTVAMKPVAAGVECDGQNEDVVRLLAASSVQPPLEWVNPYCYMPPIAPHIAAREAGQAIDLTVIQQAFVHLRAQAQVVWVEGVGGFRVPLNAQHDTADLAQRLATPVVLVIGMRLGCLNHALLTAEAITARGLTLVGWIANHLDPTMARFAANLETLQTRLDAPLIGVVPHSAAVEQAAVGFNLSVLLPG
ncbi:MAG: dethiobiotin synthase [Candidatus Contendobacter sp.]